MVAYAGVPIITSGDFAIGALCAIDVVPAPGRARRVLLCDPDGRIVHASADVCRLLGYESSEVHGRMFAELDEAENAAEWLRLRNELLVGASQEGSVRERLVCKDGSRTSVVTTMSIVRDLHGKALLTICTLRAEGA